jgi:hypothetical protein
MTMAISKDRSICGYLNGCSPTSTLQNPDTQQDKKKLIHCHWAPQTKQSATLSQQRCMKCIIHGWAKVWLKLVFCPSTCKHHANCPAFVTWRCYVNMTSNTQWDSFQATLYFQE